ncbi:hypothetical protein J4217_01295 [Candidatus Pacearchaeota archaeon]|nr:hypothetical protein [Candidatus Pacearchaeota archaeon]
MALQLPYEHRLIYTTEEAGPIKPDTLYNLVRIAPTTSETGYFRMHFFTNSENVLAGSHADISIDTERATLDLRETVCPSSQDSESFKKILNGIRLEKLLLNYPSSHGDREQFALAGEALKILQDNIQTITDNGYVINPSLFCISHDMVQVSDSFPGFFCSSFAGKAGISTHEIIKGKEEFKIVLRYTSDMKDSDEIAAYRKFMKTI